MSSAALFSHPDLLARVGQFLHSPLIGAMATVSVSCNAAFQDQATELAEERRFEQLRDWVVERMQEDEGYLYEEIEGVGSYFGVFVHDLKATATLYLFRGRGHSVVLSPSGAFAAWDNMEIRCEEDWEVLCPWLDLVDLIDLDV